MVASPGGKSCISLLAVYRGNEYRIYHGPGAIGEFLCSRDSADVCAHDGNRVRACANGSIDGLTVATGAPSRWWEISKSREGRTKPACVARDQPRRWAAVCPVSSAPCKVGHPHPARSLGAT